MDIFVYWLRNLDSTGNFPDFYSLANLVQTKFLPYGLRSQEFKAIALSLKDLIENPSKVKHLDSLLLFMLMYYYLAGLMDDEVRVALLDIMYNKDQVD